MVMKMAMDNTVLIPYISALMKKLAARIFSFLFLGLFAAPGYSHGDDSHLIDLKKLTRPSRKKIVKMGFDTYTRYDQFETSVQGPISPDEYNYNHMVFEIDRSLSDVWSAYLSSSPKSSWSGKGLLFDFAYSKRDQKIYYRDGEVPNMHEGMGVFIVLKIFNLMKITAAMEITKIDEATHTIEYTYLKKNSSNGRQIIQLSDSGNGTTRLVHDTYFKSSSRLRDRIYPKPHEDLVAQLHQNVMDVIHANLHRVE